MPLQKILNGELVDLSPEEESEHNTLQAAGAVQALEKSKQLVISTIKAEGLSRISVEFPEMTDIDQLATLWRFTTPSARSTAANTAKAIYDVAKAEITWAKDDARTQAELDAYDVVNGPTWP